jgi:hypothetical protein
MAAMAELFLTGYDAFSGIAFGTIAVVAAPSPTTPCSACATRSCPPRWAK